MTFEPRGYPERPVGQPEKLSISKLARELGRFASSNPRFRSQEVHELQLNLSETHYIESPPDINSPADEQDDDENFRQLSLDYGFLAEWTDNVYGKPAIQYNFWVASRSTVDPIPEEVINVAASHYFSAEDEDEEPAGGGLSLYENVSIDISPVMFQKKAEFFLQADGEFSVCEEFAYLDNEGDLITGNCTCVGPNELFTDQGGTTFSSFLTLGAETAPESYNSPEVALKTWATGTFDAYEDELDDYRQQRLLEMAFATSRSIRSILREMTGDRPRTRSR